MLDWVTSPEAWISLGVLTLLEIVLGIDNIVFITILTGRLPREKRLMARRLGLGVAMVSRLLLLLAIGWVMRLDDTLFHLVIPWSGKDLILLGGGLFLLYKATHEIYENVEHPEEGAEKVGAERVPKVRAALPSVVLQIMVLDVVFSLDSVITAVGMAQHIPVMMAAVVLAVIVMMVFAGPVGDFVQDNPSVRILALAFLVLIGSMLIMEATGQHVSKGYIYSAMGFSLFVQLLVMRRSAKVRKSRLGKTAGATKPAADGDAAGRD
ncbi:MAG: TerC family protein [Deltaproteobacteria bacterium]|nr:TerC family protein [Deltaproteobacteria bacterium]